MIERNGDIFTTSAKYIAHGVNVYGLMGAGIAKTMKSHFPENYEAYAESCKSLDLNPGEYLACPTAARSGSRTVIVNLASQDAPGPNARYDWLFSSLLRFARDASHPQRLRQNGGIVAIPEIGCGIGGLEWAKVKEILKCIEKMYSDIEFEVWHYVG